MKWNFNMSFDDIDKGIVSVASRSSKVRDDIHKLCVSLLARWIETGDVTVVAAKASALVGQADGYYGQSLVNWFTVYAGFAWDGKEKAFTYSKDKTKITMEEAMAAKDEPFWQLTPPKDPKAFDLPGKLQTLITQAKKKREKGLVEGFDEVPADLLRALELVMAGGIVTMPELPADTTNF